MVSVDTTYCPDIERHCLDMEHDDINNLDICHAFAHQQRCRLRPRRIAFCIDRYEYPNRAGAHPTWMLDWYQAQATCESKGKRLCYASEWTAACEGPEHTPFPYGWERNHDRCNIDNFFIEPRRWGRKGPLLFYSKDEQVALGELTRLDQSVPSGSLEGCMSGFGVADMTGNIDEWVSSDVAPREKSLWAGLKGGAWGHVRSQCRPMTFSHDPAFSYYFVGFRCCHDAEGVPGVDAVGRRRCGRPRWRPTTTLRTPSWSRVRRGHRRPSSRAAGAPSDDCAEQAPATVAQVPGGAPATARAKFLRMSCAARPIVDARRGSRRDRRARRR